MNALKKLDEALRLFEYYLSSSCVVLLALLLFGNIIARRAGRSWEFTEELGLLGIIIITYIGCIYCVRFGRNIRVTFLTDILPERFQKPIYTVVCAISCLAFFFFSYWAFLYLLQAKQLGRVTAGLAIPKWTFQIPIVIGLFFSAIQYLITTIMNIRDKEKGYLGRNREMGDEINIQ